MQITLNTEFKPVSFRYIIACWRNAANPGKELGCVRVHPGLCSTTLNGFGPNGTYVFNFYASDNGSSKDMLLDTKTIHVGVIEINYASL